MNAQNLKRYYQICRKRTHSVKTAVEQIKGKLQVISARLNRNLTDEQCLVSKLSEVRDEQLSFQSRIEKASKNLKAYKSFLATLNS